eukprot:TRINITY_DN1302_c0_g1_i3.p1 TRINITY_DN1302_c0_g1~~TRINITY_DN1302_c0_g1_i3.p1  ORF type:complete len:478 (+),score=107.77 TRINITY_DN1302_c0_g1_i3:23-1435(+)
MSEKAQPTTGGLFGMLGNGLSSVQKGFNMMIGSEGLEVVNPEGGKDDALAEADKGRFKKEERESYFKMMQKYIGADVTSMVTLPVLIFEPMTMLQKMAELMEYTELLNKADETDDASMRLVYTAAWAISAYTAFHRTWKPFNPILGETYELANYNGIQFIAEQVSHHPPISAGHGENEHFAYDCTSKVKTKFLGNSLYVYPVGRTQVKLKRTGHVIDIVPPPTKVHNLIFGRTWIDAPGDMIITNLTTEEKVVLYFQPCGWFGAGRYEVDGYVYNAAEEPTMLLTGKWNTSLSCQPCDMEGDPIPGTELQEIWHLAEMPKADKYQYTYFAHKLNSHETAPLNLLHSDSRLRPDRLALEKGDMMKSGIEKARLEERQRAEKREREARADKFTPRWFKPTGEVVETPWGPLEAFEFTGTYIERSGNQKGAAPANVGDGQTADFHPWQYENLKVDVPSEEQVAMQIVANGSAE